MAKGSSSALGFEHGQGLIAVNLAVLFFGLAGILGKLTGLPALEITFGRVLIAGAALVALGLLQKGGLAVRSRGDTVILVAQGVLLAVHWTTFFQAVLISTVAVGLLGYSTFPLFATLIEGWVVKENVSAVQALGAILVLPGIALLVPQVSLDNRTTLGVAWGMIAGVSFAVLSIVNRRLSQHYSSLTITAYQDSVATIVLLPFVLTAPKPALDARMVVLFLGLGLVCTALAHTAFIFGLRSVPTPVASLCATLEPVWGIALGVLILGQVPSIRALAGGAFILLALALPALPRLSELPAPGYLAHLAGLGGNRRRP